MVPNVVKSREGWELYIVTDGVMAGILLGEGVHWAPFQYVHIGIPDDGILRCRNM
jgi:hypothetical protein